ncbi:MAG: ribosome small subunit-dependent GTPase A [Flavobacteriales bacterium]|nr:MAG: ribosome small subunit-dependent GTPase A [Flavobacteriales bacterium]
MHGLIIKSTGSWYKVQAENGKIYDCRIQGKFRIQGIKSTNPVAVGDHVTFEPESEKNTGVITHIRDRKNYLIRKSVNLSKQKHIIAANIDQAFLLITLEYPKTYTAFIDRFLVTAEAYRIPAVLLFNKIDIYDEYLLAERDYLKDIYEAIGYQCLNISALNTQTLDQVKTLMQDKVSLFVGNSGVGKSTLINAVEPGLDLQTKPISDVHRQGQHTTTFAEMFPLSFGGYIIDTPGIRGFGLYDFTKEEMSHFFPEIFALQNDCKYHNCSHTIEPKCAVIQAVENNEIAPSRYENYLTLLEDDDIYR